MNNMLRAVVVMCVSGMLVMAAAGCEGNNSVAQLDVSKLTVKKVHAGDIDIAYKEAGSGYPLVLIMGSGSTMDFWSHALISDLARDNRVIIFDNRGIGLTSSSEQEFSIKLFADDTANLLKALNIEKANVLGWSMGAYIAQELALNYPDKVNRLILYAADSGGENAVHNPDVMAQLSDSSGTEREKRGEAVKVDIPRHVA